MTKKDKIIDIEYSTFKDNSKTINSKINSKKYQNNDKLNTDNNTTNKKSKFSTIFILFAIIGALFLFNFYNPIDYKENLSNFNGSINLQNNDDLISNNINKFTSKEELLDFVKLSKINSNNYNSPILSKNMMVDDIAESSVAFDSMRQTKSNGLNQKNSASEYSTTNTQEIGVDEADIVKNDDKYIYTISQNKVIILNAYPAEKLHIVSTIKLDKQAQIKNIFLNKNKLVVFTTSYDKELKVSDYSFIPEEISIIKTNAIIYDITNREDPIKITTFSLTGNYNDARMIDGYIYFISKQYSSYYRNDFDIPTVYKDNIKIGMPEIYYLNIPYSNYNFNTIASFDLNNLKSSLNVKSFMLESSNNLYVSQNNIYITYNQYYNFNRFDLFENVILPELPKLTQDKISSLNIKNSSFSSELNLILKEFYNNQTKLEQEDFIKKIQEKSEDYSYKKTIENQNTIIHKISIKNGNIKYDKNTTVKGHLLNQFSLSENEKEELRVATTTSIWTRKQGSEQFNNVYILDKDFKQIGKLEKIAKGEKIYSTRFIADKLYMVTFKQIDPLFVIDLEDSKNPKVLGKLKIPGYSTYLHPYDEKHLIGLGYDTKESEWGGIINNGIKLSLFDISDFKNPKEVDNYVIKGRYTDSQAVHEHKAFLFSKNKNLLSIPVREYLGENSRSEYKYSQSAYIFDIDDKGFKLKGKITHEKKELGSNYWYNSPSAIKRTLFLDNNLYTISDKYVLANNIETLELIKKEDLNYKQEDNHKYYY